MGLFRMGAKNMKNAVLLSALGLGIAFAAPASATDISFTTTLTSSSTPICFGSCHLHSAGVSASQSFQLDAAGPGQAVSLGSAWVDAGFGWDTDAALDLTLNFTAPTAGTSGETSALVQYLRLGGFIRKGITGGSITWDAPAFDFGFSGYAFELDLQNVAGWSLAGSTPINGTLKLLSAPQSGAVPEPASWALMLGGFGLVGAALRSQRKAAVAFG